MKVLVTGGTGFAGLPVCRRLLAAGHHVVAAIRRPDSLLPLGVEVRLVGDLGSDVQWRPVLEDIEAVVHLAARAHVMDERSADPLALFRRVNRDGALRLAEQAAAAGVRRFLFVSSIKVNGEATSLNRPFRSTDAPAPMDPYAISKAEAEAGLADVATRSGMLVTVVRPPLVHGPGVKGNLGVLLKVLERGVPLPLSAIHNLRSLVGVDNLADALAFLLERSEQGCFLVSDGEPISSADLARVVGQALGHPARLLPVPLALLRMGAALLNKRAAFDRLTGSLLVDDSPLRHLGWTPPHTLADGLRFMATGTR